MASNADNTLSYDFILEMFKASLDSKDFLEIMIEHCKVQYLPEGVLDLLFKEMTAQYKLEGKKPTFGTLKLAFRKNRNILEVIDEIKEIESPEVDVVISSFENFLKHNMFIDTYNKCAEEFTKGNEQKAYNMFAKSGEEIQQFTLQDGLFHEVFSGFPKRQSQRLIQQHSNIKIPTGIDQLDKVLGGGIELGEFFLFMAASKGAKSFFLVHMAIQAARSGFSCAYFNLEDTDKVLMQRMDSAWSGSIYRDIKNGIFDEKKYAAYRRIVENLGKNEIYTYTKEKFNSMNMLGIRKKIIDLKKKKDIKLVLIDYLDICPPVPESEYVYKASEERFKQQKTSELMKDTALEQNVAMISVTQASIVNQELLNDPEFVLGREHLAENRGKVRPTNGLVSFNRTFDEEKENIMRISIDAMREGRRSDVIYIKQNLDRSRFYDRKATLKEFYGNEMDGE